MSNSNFPKTLVLCFGVLVMIFVLNYLVLAWTEPTQSPPGGNVPAPLNVGNNSQTKQGMLILNASGTFQNGLGVFGNVIVLNGNVGIGISFPNSKLDVIGSIHGTNNLDIDGKISASGNIQALGSIQAGGALIAGNSSDPINGAIRFTGSGFEGYYNGKWNKLGGIGTTVTLTGSGQSPIPAFGVGPPYIHFAFVKDGLPFTFSEMPQVSITNPQTSRTPVYFQFGCYYGDSPTQVITNVTTAGFDLGSYWVIYNGCGTPYYGGVYYQPLISGWSATGKQ